MKRWFVIRYLIWIGMISGVVASTPDMTVQVDLSKVGAPYRDLLGVMKSPWLTTRSGRQIDLTDAYRLAGISEVRTNDDYVDLCKIYTDDRAIEETDGRDYADVCRFMGKVKGKLHHMTWEVNDPSHINDAANYDFTDADKSMKMVTDAGAKIYLRLGESWLGPNDVKCPEDFASVAANIYHHYLGQFKSLTFQPKVSVVEAHNEPDGGMFWRGDKRTLQSLARQTLMSIRKINPKVIMGGSGFVHGVNDHFDDKKNPLNGYIKGTSKNTP